MLNWVPKIAMWTALALGDLGRHGTSQHYTEKSNAYNNLLQKDYQTIATDNRTQGIVEKEMQLLKQTITKAGRFNNVYEFAKKYHTQIRGRIIHFYDTIAVKCNKRKKTETTDKRKKMPVEKWGKRQREKKGPNPSFGVYFQKPRSDKVPKGGAKLHGTSANGFKNNCSA